MSDRCEKNDHVMDRTCHHASDDDPEGSGQEPELRGKHRTEQRTGGGNGREMMTVQNELVGFYIIDTVRTGFSRCRTICPQTQYFVGNKKSVKPVSKSKDA